MTPERLAEIRERVESPDRPILLEVELLAEVDRQATLLAAVQAAEGVVMSRRIDALTEAQRGRMAPYAAEWIASSLRTAGDSDEADEKARAEAAILAHYDAAGLARPRRIVWTTSPMAVALAGPISAHVLGGDAVRGAVNVAVNVAVRDAVSSAVGDAVLEVVNGAVGGAVNVAVRDAVDGAVRGAVGDAVNVAVKNHWWRRLGGSLWPGWCAWRAYFVEECGLELPPEPAARLAAWTEVSRCCGWWWPHRDFVVACWRHTSVHMDDSGGLHREDGPAIVWPDGWGVYSWRGLRVPREIIMEPVTVARIDGTDNAEHRRVLIERYGSTRYALDSGAVVIHECLDEVGVPMRLLRREVQDDEDIVLLHVQNTTVDPDGSRRGYHLRVPPTMTECYAARNWGLDLSPTTRLDAQS